MSDVRSGVRHADPLEALRAADHRPLHLIWRERSIEAATRAVAAIVRSRLHLAVAVVLIGVIGWRMFLSTEPPVEASIPFAPGAGVESPLVTAPVGGAPTVVTPSADVSAASIPEDVIVHVAGAVRVPGLVVGRPGWRVNDAILAAGGSIEGADVDRVNLAATAVDGERIFVPFIGEDIPTVVARTSPDVPDEARTVNVNTATALELEALPGIGPAMAVTIITHREEHGMFGSVDTLVAVRGIGPATLERLRDHISVG